MRVKRIEHVGIVVEDLGASRVFWEGCLGLRCETVEELAQYQVRLAMYPVGQSMVELLTSTIPDGKYSKMVREGKAGLHHICLEVEDIDAALAELKSKGVRLLDEKPRPGHEGRRIAFLDPESAGQVLVELVEAPESK
jgi:methylmalonyl-CoA/ethylmalonyl-CoA epimerase